MNIYFKEIPNINDTSDNYYKQTLYVLKQSYFDNCNDDQKKMFYNMFANMSNLSDDFKNFINIDYVKQRTQVVSTYIPEFNDDNILTTNSRHRYAEFSSLCDSFDVPCYLTSYDVLEHPTIINNYINSNTIRTTRFSPNIIITD